MKRINQILLYLNLLFVFIYILMSIISRQLITPILPSTVLILISSGAYIFYNPNKADWFGENTDIPTNITIVTSYVIAFLGFSVALLINVSPLLFFIKESLSK